MRKANSSVGDLLDQLESYYGPQVPDWPTDPYLFLLWWQRGYPASDAACSKGWTALNQVTNTDPASILKIATPKLAAALKAGGMVPELRALRLKELAASVKDEFGDDLRDALVGPIARARKTLKKFPGIAEPGADRILLFGGITAVAAVPSNCPQVLVRIVRGSETENYSQTYKEAQQAIESGTRATFYARTRAYLLLKRHGQEICKRSRPKCGECPVNANCAYFKAR